MSRNLQVLYRRPVRGTPVPEDFELTASAMPQAAEGQFVVRNLYLALEPYYRNILKGMALYGTTLQPGDVMYGETIGQVIATRHPQYATGDYVLARGGWQQYARLNGTNVRKLEPGKLPLSTALGVLGTPGLTGYAGLVYLAPPRPGQTVVVSAATGPVGSTAGQTARLMGARVIGIAGSTEKCAYAVHSLGFEHCINYKQDDLASALRTACPDGIDVYFDNVGGATLAAVLGNLARHAQVILCGMMGAYNAEGPPAGPHLGPVIIARATLKGLVVFDYLHHLPELQRVVGGWILNGQFHYREDISESLEQAPRAFCRLMRGENFGKTLVRIAPESA